MFDRITNVFLFSCLFCLTLSLLTGCSDKIGNKWIAVATGIATDATTDVTTAVIGGLDKSTEYEFRLSATSKNDPLVPAFDAIIINTKATDASEADDVDEIEFKAVGKKEDKKNTSVTLTWNNNQAYIFKLEVRKSPGPAPPKTEVIVTNVAQDDVRIYIYTDGLTVPSNSVEIRTRVSGYLEELFFEPGAIVKKGDQLAQIEKASYDIALLAAKAELANSEARAALAVANLEREKVLLEKGAGTQADYQTQLANYEMALAAIELANASIRNAQLNLDYTTLHSPITGKTTKYLVDPGNFVSPTGVQAVLLSITQLDPMFVEFKLSDRQFSDLKDRLGFREVFYKAVSTPEEEQGENPSARPLALTGMDVDVSLMTGVNVFNFDFNIPGKVVALVDDRISFAGQITLRAEVRNPLLNTDASDDYMLYAGQVCRVRVPYEVVKNAVLVREEAILTDLDTKYVLVVARGMYQPRGTDGKPLLDDDGNEVPPYETDIVERRDIEIGRLLDTQMRIVEDHPLKPGVKPGETYIVQGLQRVRIGMEVKPTTLQDYEIRRAAERNGR